MNETVIQRPHWSFWLIGVVGLSWYLMGTANFLAQLSPEFVASMPETHRTIIESRPLWATFSFGIAVIIGVLGCLLLIRRRDIAFYMFVVSLIAVIVTLGPFLHLIGTTITDPFEIFMMVVTSPLVAVFLIWYTRFAESRAWLNKF
jgi:drug/metabolite transporter (DMT)-like permease